jgi:hypothetical protein
MEALDPFVLNEERDGGERPTMHVSDLSSLTRRP